jgi:hypothetical protein
MKLFRIIATVVLASIAALTSPLHAATSTQTFKVNLTLTPMCYINITATPSNGTVTDVNLAYTSFQATAAQASTSFNVKCTNLLSYGVSIDAPAPILGINYSVYLNAGAVQYTGSTSVTGQTGTGADQSFSVGVEAAANQSGDCNSLTTCTGFHTHTVTVTY